MPKTYYDNYLFYSSENEASPRYHKWACLATLSVAMSRRVWVSQGDWRVYPNLYLLFVGDPASGKSVALSFAEKLVQAFTQYPIAPNSITREMLAQTMGRADKQSFLHNGVITEFSHMTVFSDELVMFLGSEPLRMIDFLTAIYSAEGPFSIATKNKGSDVIVNPCLVLLGLLTPNTLSSMLTQNLVSGGFSRRALLVYAKDRGVPKPRPKFTDAHAAAKQQCVEYARKLQSMSGQFVWTPEAEAWFDDWYINVKDPTMRAEQNDVLKRYWSAKDVLLLKVAMLYALSQEPDLTLSIESLIMADEMLTELESDILTVFGGGGRNELAPITHQVYLFINEHPGVKETMIRARFLNAASDSEIRDMLTHLTDTGRVIKKTEINAGSGALTHTYVSKASETQKPATKGG